MGASKWFFSASGMILLIGAFAIAGNGLNFGIDFEGGTRITAPLAKAASVDDVRSALAGAGLTDAEVQTIDNPDLGKNLVQISSGSGPDKIAAAQKVIEDQFGFADPPTTESIGPTFGQSVARSALIAIIASLTVISVYIALRFEWKVAVPVLIALLHDILITGGVYALTGREVTTSTVAALLTILGFSLYDTIIVFDRVRENIPRMPSAAFSQIVNRSMSEVVVRSLATSFCTLLPVLCLYFFGGDTLKDFAFALIVGTASGTYSSIFIAAPVLTHWKQREPVYAARERRIKERLGYVPAYATADQGGPVDVAPRRARPPRRRHRDAGSLAGRLAGGVRRHGRQPRDRGGGPARARRRGRAEQPPRGRPPCPRTRRDPAGPARGRHRPVRHRLRQRGRGRGAQAQEAAQPQAREAALMGLLVWIMVAIALWHFTIFLPDHWWAGIVGAFVGSVVGSVIFGLIIHLGTIPGQNDTDLLTAIESVPGALLGMAAVWFIGVRGEQHEHEHHAHA